MAPLPSLLQNAVILTFIQKIYVLFFLIRNLAFPFLADSSPESKPRPQHKPHVEVSSATPDDPSLTASSIRYVHDSQQAARVPIDVIPASRDTPLQRTGNMVHFRDVPKAVLSGLSLLARNPLVLPVGLLSQASFAHALFDSPPKDVLVALTSPLSPLALTITLTTTSSFASAIGYQSLLLRTRAYRFRLFLFGELLAYILSIAGSDAEGGQELWIISIVLATFSALLPVPSFQIQQSTPPPEARDGGCSNCGRPTCPGCGAGPSSGNEDQV